MTKTVVCFGEVLWDLLPSGKVIGGAPFNVNYHLSKNNIQSYLISAIGDDILGEEILEDMKSKKLSSTFINRQKYYPTSTVEVIIDEVGKASYKIVEEVAWDNISISEEVKDQVVDSDVFIYGSLACRSDITKNTLMEYLRISKYNVFDMNLRFPFYNKELILELINYSHTLKLNEEELELLNTWMKSPYKDERSILENILKSFPNIRDIILTKGADGVVYVNKELFLSKNAYKVTLKDTVGCGDSFLASFIAHILQSKSIEKSIEKATLLSAFVASHYGGCPYYDVDLLDDFEQKISQ